MLNYVADATFKRNAGEFDKLDDTALRRNQRSVERHIDYDHYTCTFTPGEFVLALGSAHVAIPAAAPQWPAVELPNAALTLAVVSWYKPSEWRTGRLRMRFRYTSDIAGVATFNVGYRVRAIKVGEVLPATLLTADPVALLLAGPAVANTELSTTDLYTTVSFGSDDERFSLQIFRDGAADANNNNLHLLSVLIEHIPAVQESA